MARKKTQDEKDNDLLLANTREVLKTRAGKDVLWYIIGLCQLYTNKFTGNSTTFMLLGKEAVGLEILQLLEDADPLAYPNLLLERHKRDQAQGHDGAEEDAVDDTGVLGEQQ